MPEPEFSFGERERTHLLDEAENAYKELKALQTRLVHVMEELEEAKTNAQYLYDRLDKAQPKASQVESQVEPQVDGMTEMVGLVLESLLEAFYYEGFRMIHRSDNSRKAQIEETGTLKGLVVAWRRIIQERLGVGVNLPFSYEEDL